jgi:hypothetical protein
MNGKWTKDNFDVYNKENPDIYSLFEKYAMEASKHRSKYSAKIIFHIIRWNTMLSGKDSEYKIDDGWISHYARLFMDKHPELNGFFETRTRKDTYHK